LEAAGSGKRYFSPLNGGDENHSLAIWTGWGVCGAIVVISVLRNINPKSWMLQRRRTEFAISLQRFRNAPGSLDPLSFWNCMIPVKSRTPIRRCLVGACSMLVCVSATQAAVVVEPFESGQFNGWAAKTLDGVVTTVSTDRATDGVFGGGSSFIEPASFSDRTVNMVIGKDPRGFMEAGSTTLTVGVYSNWSNSNGWGVYGDTKMLILNNSHIWTAVAPSSASLMNEAFSPFTWDMPPMLERPRIGDSAIPSSLPPGTWEPGLEGRTD